MWSSSGVARAAVLALALSATAALAGCTSFRPVYGEAGPADGIDLRYATPVSRLDQIIYQDLTLRLGRSADPSAPLLTVTTTSKTRALTKSDVLRPSEQREATVTAEITLTGSDGSVLFSTTRSAAAPYTIDGQGLADNEAEREAKERAAKSLAETIRLTLLGAAGTGTT